MIQKRVSKRFRKKMSSEAKKRQTDIIKETKDNSLNNLLYSLPLELKIKIFQMSVQSNLEQWLRDHKGNFKGSLDFLDSTINFGYTELKGEHRDGFWVWYEEDGLVTREDLEKHEDGRYFQHSTLCDKIDGYDEVYLPHPQDNHEFWMREWRDQVDTYWYCEDCRCFKCDQVKAAKGKYEILKNKQREEVVKERCTRILEECSMATTSQRFMVERAIELVDNHYLNDPE
jgi:hypothetical protein